MKQRIITFYFGEVFRYLASRTRTSTRGLVIVRVAVAKCRCELAKFMGKCNKFVLTNTNASPRGFLLVFFNIRMRNSTHNSLVYFIRLVFCAAP